MARPSLPTVGGSTDSWGTELNSALTDARGEMDNRSSVNVIVSGRWYDQRNFIPGDYSNQVLQQDTLYASPLIVPRSGMAVDRIQVYVAVAQAGGTVRIGIYDGDGTDYAPSTLITDSGTVSVATTGSKTITISETLTPDNDLGLVWLTMITDVSTGFTSPKFFCLYEDQKVPIMGRTSDSSYTSNVNAYTRSFTYAALPDPFGSGSWGRYPFLFSLRAT